jgi:hypothetical protein
MGSHPELETQIEIGRRRRYIKPDDMRTAVDIADQVGRLLNGLASSLERQIIYEVTERFPRREHFGLAAQLRKAAVSIPSNVAECDPPDPSRVATP